MAALPDDEKKEDTDLDVSQIAQKKRFGLKNKVLIGTFDSEAFHYSLKDCSDPLSVGLFPIFGYPKIPLIGVYSQSYEPIIPKVLLELRLDQKTKANLPQSVQKCIGDIQSHNDKLSLSDIDLFFLIHTRVRTQECQHFQCSSRTEFNIMYHTWFYNRVDDMNDDQQMEATMLYAIFEPVNIAPVHQDSKSQVDRGAPFNALGQRSVFLHGMAFSPCNGHIGRDMETGFCYFFAVGCTKDYKRAVVSFHVFPNSDDCDDLLKFAVKEAPNLVQLRNGLAMLSWGETCPIFEALTGVTAPSQ